MKIRNVYQIDLFNNSENKHIITKPIRLIELFSGIGFQRMGISRVFPNMQSWKTCEWAAPSIIGYDAIWNGKQEDEQFEKEFLVDRLYELGISFDYNKPATLKQIKAKPLPYLNHLYNCILRTHDLVNVMNVKGSDLEIVDTDQYEYWLSYSFPCQSLSAAGKREGMSKSQKEEGGTRSGLVWEVLRILQECGEHKPNLIMENVKEIHNKKNIKEFLKLQQELEKLGYKSFWQDMCGLDYNVPQNRIRTFMISIYKEDTVYSFPEPVKLQRQLSDLEEENVDKKYFLNKKMVDYITGANYDNSKFNRKKAFERKQKYIEDLDIAGTITTREGQRSLDTFVAVKVVGNYSPSGHNAANVVDPSGAAPTLMENHRTRTAIMVRNNNSKGYLEAHEGDGIDMSTRMHHHRGTVQKGVSQTLTTQADIGIVVNGGGLLQFRKLTPLECTRLMDADDQVYYALRDIAKLTEGQIIHIMGDGLIAAIPEFIFREMKGEN